MSLSVSLDEDGSSLVVTHLLGVEHRTLHARPAFGVIGLQMLHAERQLFDSQGAYAGTPWKRNSPEWTAEKARRGLDRRVNHATRRARRSLTQRGNPEQIRRSTDRGIEFGSKVPHVKYMQDPIRFGTLQQRQFNRTLTRWFVEGVL